MSGNVAFFVAGAAFLGSGLLALLALPALRRHALDVPNARSSHDTPIPRGGGFAVVVATVMAVVAGVGLIAAVDSGDVAATLLGVLLLAALGLADDLRGLHELVRFGVQVVVSVTVSYLLVADSSDGVAVTAGLTLLAGLWLTSFTNAFNFMDGINGISGVTACVGAGWYLWLGHRYDLPAVALLSAGLLGAAAGFLPLNFPRARLFLGDVGSYGIGVLLACLAILTWIGGAGWLPSVAPLLVYVADTGWTLLRRMHRREKWWKAHRENVYQRLTARGASPVFVTLLVGSLSLATCLLALDQHGAFNIGAVLVILLAYVASPDLAAGRRT